jgi:hypothetical protein
MLRIKERTPTHFSSVVFTFQLVFEFLKKFGGALKTKSQLLNEDVQFHIP